MHYLIKKAYNEMYPQKNIDFEAKIKYSRAFKAYNANVKYFKDMSNFEFHLSYNTSPFCISLMKDPCSGFLQIGMTSKGIFLAIDLSVRRYFMAKR